MSFPSNPDFETGNQIDTLQLGKIEGAHKEILTPEALTFLATLHRNFDATRKQVNLSLPCHAKEWLNLSGEMQCLQRRVLFQNQLDAGALPDFLPETKHIREDDTWVGAPPCEFQFIYYTGVN